MLRNLQTISNKNVDAMFKAAVPMKRGLLVQKNHATKSAVLPTSQEGLYFVTKGSFPTGVMCAEGELSDYDTRFETIAANEYVVLEKPVSGERYGISEFVAAGLTAGDYMIAEVAVGADQGKLKKNATATPFKYAGTIVDNGVTLAVVEVL